MRILYIPRKPESRGWQSDLKRNALGLLDGQDGFFEAALHRAGHVTLRPLDAVMAMEPAIRARFDAVVVNAKSDLAWQDAAGATALCALFARPVALFLGFARARFMPANAVLSAYHTVFKREPYADLGRYDLSARNADKVVPTHLSNPFEPLSRRFAWGIPPSKPKRMGWDVPTDKDVFFLGKTQEGEHLARKDSWAKVVASGLAARGGLFPRKGYDLPAELHASHLEKPEYLRQLQASRVNLGLEGIGSFTFRHLETLWAGSFLLSNPTVPEQRLRAPLIDGEDYVSFQDHDDMIDKIRHYATHEPERQRIAKNGRRAYERLHDVLAHAGEIKTALAA
ncbi:MAG: glycosyltransferase [Pseudomonadota bacterium]